MGSNIELNDTLQLTREQGFPVELDLEKHLQTPITAEGLQGKIFHFTGKPGIRNYHMPPVRNFLVENREGKWIYWGLVHIREISHDYTQRTTSGLFEIHYIYSPDEMKKAHDLIDRRTEVQFFK